MKITLNTLESLTEDELGIALYIVNKISPPTSPIMEFGPRHLTWFRHDVLAHKFLSAFNHLTLEAHPVYSSMLTKLGIPHEIKYEQPAKPVAPVTQSMEPVVPDTSLPITSSTEVTQSNIS